MIVKTEIADFLKDQAGMKMKEELEKSMALLPMFLTFTIQLVGTHAVAMALLKSLYIVGFTFGSSVLLIMIVLNVSLSGQVGTLNTIITTMTTMGRDTSVSLKTIMSSTKNAKGYIMYKLCVVIFNNVLLTSLVIAANYLPDADVGVGKFSDTTIVKNLYILNTIFIVVLVSGAVSLFLTYIQIVEPTAEAEYAKNENAKDETKDEKKDNVDDEAEDDTANSSNA